MSEVECGRCGDICSVEGEGYKWSAWCDTCDDYAAGFDGEEWFADRMAGIADGHRKQVREAQ